MPLCCSNDLAQSKSIYSFWVHSGFFPNTHVISLCLICKVHLRAHCSTDQPRARRSQLNSNSVRHRASLFGFVSVSTRQMNQCRPKMTDTLVKSDALLLEGVFDVNEDVSTGARENERSQAIGFQFERFESARMTAPSTLVQFYRESRVCFSSQRYKQAYFRSFR